MTVRAAEETSPDLIRPVPIFLHLDAAESRRSAVPVEHGARAEKIHVNAAAPVNKAEPLERRFHKASETGLQCPLSKLPNVFRMDMLA